MTPTEFKAWFDGYLEGYGGGPPDPDQWGIICEKIEALQPDFSSVIPVPVSTYPADPIYPQFVTGDPIGPLYTTTCKANGEN